MSLPAGPRLGANEILDPIGGRGEVCRARDTSASRRAAAGVPDDDPTGSMGDSADGRGLTTARLHQPKDLLLAERLAGVEPPARVGRVG